MTYLEQLPSKQLIGCVDAYWYFENSEGEILRQQIPADGCVDIIFPFRSDKRPFVSGPMTRPIHTRLNPGERMFGVRLRPGAARLFFNMSLNEITDQTEPLSMINRSLESKLGRLPDSIHMRSAVNVFEACAIRLAAMNDIPDRALEAINLIERSRGGLSIVEVALHCRCSIRSLERIFSEYVGFSPKIYSRIVRFRFACRLLGSTKETMAEVALKAGYYDQAHFSRDYKRFAGVSPLLGAMSHLYNT